MKNQQGFSLIEVVIGISILASILGVFIIGVRSARKEAEFSDKHLSVLLCSQKVIEDLMEEIWVNPLGFLALGIENDFSPPTPITEGKSVFFSNLESVGDGPSRNDVIGPEMKPLYNQVEDLKLNVLAKRMAPVTENRPESNLYHGDISFVWDGKRGKGQGVVESLFFSPITPKRISPGSFVDPASSDASYAAILGSVGGSPELLKSLGEVYRACRAFISSDFFVESYNEIQKLKKVSRGCRFPSKELYNCHTRLACVWYEMARRSLNFLLYIEPAMTAFSSRYSPGSLGSEFEKQSWKLKAIMRDFRLVYETLVSSLLQARANYQFIVSPPLAGYKGIRMQFHLIIRVIDLYRVLMLIPTHPYGLAEYRNFLRQLDAFGKGRSPGLSRMVAFELANSQTFGQVVERLPNMKQLDTLFGQKMRPILGFIRKTLTTQDPVTKN